MQKKDASYKKISDEFSPPSSVVKNCTKAFFSGGILCLEAQMITNTFMYFGVGKENAGIWTSILMVFLGVLFTGLGWYSKLAKHAGAGMLVPITGFANAVSSPAIEYKTEGMITGIAAKMFIISGPVIVYGILTAWIFGIFRFIIGVVS